MSMHWTVVLHRVSSSVVGCAVAVPTKQREGHHFCFRVYATGDITNIKVRYVFSVVDEVMAQPLLPSHPIPSHLILFVAE